MIDLYEYMKTPFAPFILMGALAVLLIIVYWAILATAAVLEFLELRSYRRRLRHVRNDLTSNTGL